MTDKPEPRRFALPRIAGDTDACFIVRDARRASAGYVHCEDEPGPAGGGASATRGAARRIAVNITKLPELLSR